MGEHVLSWNTCNYWGKRTSFYGPYCIIRSFLFRSILLYLHITMNIPLSKVSLLLSLALPSFIRAPVPAPAQTHNTKLHKRQISALAAGLTGEGSSKSSRALMMLVTRIKWRERLRVSFFRICVFHKWLLSTLGSRILNHYFPENVTKTAKGSVR
jgi:hypothetical protein